MKNVKYLPHECFYVKTHILVIQSTMQATLKFVYNFFFVGVAFVGQLLVLQNLSEFIVFHLMMYATRIFYATKLFFIHFYSTSLTMTMMMMVVWEREK